MATSSEVPQRFPVALNGRPFMLDDRLPWAGASPYFGRESIPLLRQQADNASTPSEHSINPDDLWRRAMESWHMGAGQTFLDRPTSDPFRFNASEGVNVWTRHRLDLLPLAQAKTSTANTNLAVVSVGSRLYKADGTGLSYTTDVTVGSPSFTAVTGTPGVTISSLASDGFNVWLAVGASGLYTTTRTSGAASQLVTSALLAGAVVGYVKGRLMVANANKVYNVTLAAAAALPAALLTQANTDFRWVGFAEGTNCLWMAGYSGDRSLIYRTAVRSDGTALDSPVVAGELPDGLVVRSVQGYLGFLLIGTDQGVRFAAANGAGDLQIGSLIQIGSAVRCFEAQDRFVWFGWSDYLTTELFHEACLGRLDLTAFTAPLTPAYATDLATGTANLTVTSIATFQSRTVFTVTGTNGGVWAESTIPVAYGRLANGRITYGLGDQKVAYALDVRRYTGGGGYRPELVVDGGSPVTSLGSALSGASFDTYALLARGERFEVTHVLFPPAGASVHHALASAGGPAATTDTAPTLYRATLEADPVPSRSKNLSVPLRIDAQVADLLGGNYEMDVAGELAAIEALVESGAAVTYQEGTSSRTVKVQDYIWHPGPMTADRSTFGGTCIVQLKDLSVPRSGFRAVAKALSNATTALASTLPTYLVGDYLVAVVESNNAPSATPTGWTALVAVGDLHAYGKVAAPNEVAPTITFASTSGASVQILSYANLAPSGTPASATGNSAIARPGTVTSTAANTTVVMAASVVRASVSETPVLSMQTRLSASFSVTVSHFSCAVGDTVQTAASPTDEFATLSAAFLWSALLIPLVSSL